MEEIIKLSIHPKLVDKINFQAGETSWRISGELMENRSESISRSDREGCQMSVEGFGEQI